MKPKSLRTCACGNTYALNRTGRPAVRCPKCAKDVKRARDMARYRGEPFRVPSVNVEPPTRPEELGPAEPLLVSRAERQAYETRRILQRHDEGVEPVGIAQTVGVHAAEVRRVLLEHKRKVTRERGLALGVPAWGQ